MEWSTISNSPSRRSSKRYSKPIQNRRVPQEIYNLWLSSAKASWLVLTYSIVPYWVNWGSTRQPSRTQRRLPLRWENYSKWHSTFARSRGGSKCWLDQPIPLNRHSTPTSRGLCQEEEVLASRMIPYQRDKYTPRKMRLPSPNWLLIRPTTPYKKWANKRDLNRCHWLRRNNSTKLRDNYTIGETTQKTMKNTLERSWKYPLMRKMMISDLCWVFRMSKNGSKTST